MSRKGYAPPYTINDNIVNLISYITELITKITINDTMDSNPKLKRENRIRMIHASLTIENNSLSLDQMTDIIDGKRVLGTTNDIREVKNAFKAYNILLEMNPFSIDTMLFIHKMLMDGLTGEAGMFRNGGVGVFAGQKLVHMAPPASQGAYLINDLIDWAKEENVHPLIKSCLFHYEFECIHPFIDGNGRMGRMWQTLLLDQWKTLFGWLPIETLIREKQEEYYAVLGACDHDGDSGKFIEFMLETIYHALKQRTDTEQVTEQVGKLIDIIGDNEYSTNELMQLLGLKHRPNFRNKYLLPALSLGYIEMTIPDKPNSSKQKYKKYKE